MAINSNPFDDMDAEAPSDETGSTEPKISDRNPSELNEPTQDQPDQTGDLFDDISSPETSLSEDETYLDSVEFTGKETEQKERDGAFKRMFSWLRRKEKPQDQALQTAIDSRLQHLGKPEDNSGIIEEAGATETQEYIPIAESTQVDGSSKDELTPTKIVASEAPQEVEQAEAPEIQETQETITLEPATGFVHKPDLEFPHEDESQPDIAEKVVVPDVTSEDEWVDFGVDIDEVRKALTPENTPEEDVSINLPDEVEEGASSIPPAGANPNETIDFTSLREAFLARNEEKPAIKQDEDFLDTDGWVFEDLGEKETSGLLGTLEDDYTPPTKVDEEETEADEKSADPTLLNTLEDEWLDLDIDTPETSKISTDFATSKDTSIEPSKATEEITPSETGNVEFEETSSEAPGSTAEPEHYERLLDMRKGILDDMEPSIGYVQEGIVEAPPPSGPEDAFLEVPDDFVLVEEEQIRKEPEKKKIKFNWLWVIIPVIFILTLSVAIGIYTVITRSLNPSTEQLSIFVSDDGENPYESTTIYPTGIMLTGGWYFGLNPGTIGDDGTWKPTSAEWLFGTELRRVVALPWTKQLEAVVSSLETGSEINLEMSNEDLLPYQVDQVKKVPRDQTDVLYGSKASLLVILYDETSDDRWIVICSPAE